MQRGVPEPPALPLHRRLRADELELRRVPARHRRLPRPRLRGHGDLSVALRKVRTYVPRRQALHQRGVRQEVRARRLY